LRLALSKRPNRVDVSFPSAEEGSRYIFRNTVFSSYLELRTMDKVLRPSDSMGNKFVLVDTKLLRIFASCFYDLATFRPWEGGGVFSRQNMDFTVE
jgi:hypothetical protein